MLSLGFKNADVNHNEKESNTYKMFDSEEWKNKSEEGRHPHSGSLARVHPNFRVGEWYMELKMVK